MTQALCEDAVRLFRIQSWVKGELSRLGYGPGGPYSNRLEDHEWWTQAIFDSQDLGPLDPREEAIRECARWLSGPYKIASEDLLVAMGLKP
jgi:hypothetical protein